MTDDTKALVARLRTSHGQIVHEFYSKDGKLYCDCAICDAADLIERQGNALRAVEALESFGAMVELTTLLGTREMVTGAEVEVVSAAQLRAALAERGANDKHE